MESEVCVGEGLNSANGDRRPHFLHPHSEVQRSQRAGEWDFDTGAYPQILRDYGKALTAGVLFAMRA